MSERHYIVEAFSELSSRYEQVVDAELQRFWGWSYDGFVDNMVNLTKIQSGDRLLDIATGTSVIPLKLLARGDPVGKITGLDITYSMLEKGRQKIRKRGAGELISSVCGNAMAMPFQNGWFDVIVCGLATHHLDVAILLNEMSRLLRPGGRLTIADVGWSAALRKPPINWVIKTATLVYFLPKEGYARSRAELAALSHVLTPSEWKGLLIALNFKDISVEQLEKKRAWVPAPLVVRAIKPSGGELTS